MAWEWSHTGEAYANAEANLREMPRDILEVIWAEWKGRAVGGDESDHEGYDSTKYEAALHESKSLSEEFMADDIWARMSEQAICENGGFQAWACPYGCGCHLVSFDREAEEVEQ